MDGRGMGNWMPLQGAANLIWAAQMFRDLGFTHAEIAEGESISIAEALGKRLFELMDAQRAA